MYNQEIKEKFIAEFTTNTSRRKAAVTMFNAMEPYEEKWGADFCTRTKEELEPVVEELVGFRSDSKRLRMSMLKLYVRWCMSNGVPGACDQLFLVDDNGLKKMKRQTVANPQHLQRYLNCLFPPESEETVDNVYRCFYWLAFAGVKDEDAVILPTSCVDFMDLAVRCNGNEYPIYREAIPAFKNCVNLTEFKFNHPCYCDKIVRKPRSDGNKLLRGLGKSEVYTLTSMRAKISRKEKEVSHMSASDSTDENLDLKLSYYRVQLSGLFYRTYEAERAGMPVDFTAAARQFMEGKNYKFSNGRASMRARERELKRNYLNDYNRWKEAYMIL